MSMETQQQTATPAIYGAMATILEGVEAIAKDRKGDGLRFTYRGVDDVYYVIHPLMKRTGVFILPTVESMTREERQTSNGKAMLHTVLTVRLRFQARDGSFVECVGVGEGSDNGDKSAQKAVSVAMKSALLAIFAIPTEDPTKDPEHENAEFQPKQAPPPQVPTDPRERLLATILRVLKRMVPGDDKAEAVREGRRKTVAEAFEGLTEWADVRQLDQKALTTGLDKLAVLEAELKQSKSGAA